MMKRALSWNGESAMCFDDLPPEIALDIFLRLPVKTLVRSSAVSKTWYSLVKNPTFVSSQISISCCNENAVLIIPTNIGHRKYCSLICAETGCVFDKYEIPFNTRTGTLQLVGSVNGLLCFTDKVFRNPNDDPYPRADFVYRNLYVWNPSIRKYKSIGTSFRQRYVYDKFKISYAVGFGFHEPSHDYRVVRIMYVNDKQGNQVAKLTPRVEVFSSRMNNWRPWRVINNTIVPEVASKIGTTVYGTVYWLKERSYETYSEEVSILSFDFNSEVFGQLNLPDDVRYSLGETASFQLMKFEGSLCVCVRNNLTVINGICSEPCCIWQISHKDGIASSKIRFRVVLEKFGRPLNITKSGALIMGSLPQRHFGCINC